MTYYPALPLILASASLALNAWIAAQLFLRHKQRLGVRLLYPSINLNPASGNGADGAELSLLEKRQKLARDINNGKAASGLQAAWQAGIPKDSAFPLFATDGQKTYLIDSNGEVTQVNNIDCERGKINVQPYQNIDLNAQTHPITPDKPDHVADAQYQAGSGNSQRQPILNFHNSAPLSKERPACPCNLLL